LRSWRIRSFCAVLVLAVLPACGGGAGRSGTVPAVAPAPASSPAEVVERFMRMVAAKNYMGMGQLFGNVEGPVTSREPQQRVERWMYAIGSILTNDRFTISGVGQPIPGRGPEVTQLTVRITQGGETRDVPFVVVRASAGGYLVEQVDLQAITRNP
jgi:hypothetical protein